MGIALELRRVRDPELHREIARVVRTEAVRELRRGIVLVVRMEAVRGVVRVGAVHRSRDRVVDRRNRLVRHRRLDLPRRAGPRNLGPHSRVDLPTRAGPLSSRGQRVVRRRGRVRRRTGVRVGSLDRFLLRSQFTVPGMGCAAPSGRFHSGRTMAHDAEVPESRLRNQLRPSGNHCRYGA